MGSFAISTRCGKARRLPAAAMDRYFVTTSSTPYCFGKLQFVVEHPLNFLRVALITLDYSGELWRQAIGVFGSLDIKMRSWAYPFISGLLALTFFDKLDFEHGSRLRVGLVAGTTILAYY